MSFSKLSLPSTALIVIDVQKAFDHEMFANRQRSTPNMQANITALLGAFRAAKLPVIHIHHIDTEKSDPQGESPWNEKTFPEYVLPMEYVAPIAGEPVLRKYAKSSSFHARLVEDGKTPLKEVLDVQLQGIKTIVLVGMSSAHCVASTARAGYDLEYQVVVVGDATATMNSGVVTAYEGAPVGDAKEGRNWSAETVHAVCMAHLDGEFGEVLATKDVLKHLQ